MQLRRRPLGRKQEQPPGRGVSVGGAQHPVEHPGQETVSFRVLGVGDGVGEVGCRPAGLPIYERNEKSCGTAELLVEQRPVDAGLLRDLVRCRGVKALGVDDRVGDIEDLLTSRLACHAPPADRDHLDSINNDLLAVTNET